LETKTSKTEISKTLRRPKHASMSRQRTSVDAATHHGTHQARKSGGGRPKTSFYFAPGQTHFPLGQVFQSRIG
jgi:hypothetical protein